MKHSKPLTKPIETYDKTNNLYDKATEIGPNNSLVWFNKGTALNKLNESDLQVEYLLNIYLLSIFLDINIATFWLFNI